ncbi:hypothetical protein C8R44DRAFT_731547 [Mycena epipterygia]|nr:hypothetical protein C8R44DRAFT_731547 [Mycena epipterygia]
MTRVGLSRRLTKAPWWSSDKPVSPMFHTTIILSASRSYSRIVISGCEPVVVQIAVLRVASGNPWLARPPNPAEPRLADDRRWAALAAHGLNRLAAASRHLAGTSGYLWIGGAVVRALRLLASENPFRKLRQVLKSFFPGSTAHMPMKTASNVEMHKPFLRENYQPGARLANYDTLP